MEDQTLIISCIDKRIPCSIFGNTVVFVTAAREYNEDTDEISGYRDS